MTDAPPKRRSSDQRWWRRIKWRKVRAWWDRWGRDVTTIAAVAVAAYAVISAGNAADDATHAARESRAAAAQARAVALSVKRESAARIDQSCAISEQKQRSDSDALRRTYEYLAGLSGKQFEENINKAVLAGLPATIRNAQVDDAPRFCDRPGVGLPEPDPPRPCPRHGERPKGCIAPPTNLPPVG